MIEFKQNEQAQPGANAGAESRGWDEKPRGCIRCGLKPPRAPHADSDRSRGGRGSARGTIRPPAATSGYLGVQRREDDTEGKETQKKKNVFRLSTDYVSADPKGRVSLTRMPWRQRGLRVRPGRGGDRRAPPERGDTRGV